MRAKIDFVVVKMEGQGILEALLPIFFSKLLTAVGCLSSILASMSALKHLHRVRRRRCSLRLTMQSSVRPYALARRKRKLLKQRRFWIRPSRTSLWWQNLIAGKMIDEE